jgi:hypothetical protein
MAVLEQVIQRDIDFDSDSTGRLIYWDCITSAHPLLEPTQPITDPHIIVGKIGQQNILPTHFTLKPKDLVETELEDEDGQVLGEPIPPGISTFLFFGSRETRQDCLDNITRSNLGREPHYKNRLYVAQIGDIREAGWTTYYAPLIRGPHFPNPLHVIIVPNSILASGITADATEEEKTAIASVFVKWHC